MLIQVINIDKIDNNSKDYTFLGKHVKQVERFPRAIAFEAFWDDQACECTQKIS